jgi:hypothetical protein
MYEDLFDAEYCVSVAADIERLILRSYSSMVLPQESKKRILDLGTSSIIYASLHKSHLDYIVICGKMFLEGLSCPRTIAGSNLLTGILGWSVKKFTGINMMKWGAVPLKRGLSISHELPALCTQIETLLKSNIPILVFPEIETSTNGNGNVIKTGRAYSGKIRRFSSALFGSPIKVSKEGKKVYILPMSVSYDFVAEDGYFSSLIKSYKMKTSENRLISLAGRLYYTFLESHFFYNMYRLGKGNIYIDIGQPILVEPNASKKELAQRAQEGAARGSRITMPALVSYVISKGATSKDGLQKSAEHYTSMLRKANANFSMSLGLKEGIEWALGDLTEKRIISSFNGTILVKKPQIINYYANTIAHHLERT